LCFVGILKPFLWSKSRGGIETIISNVFRRFWCVRYAKGTLCAQTTVIRLVTSSLHISLYSKTSPVLPSRLISSISPSRRCRRSSRVVQLSTSLSQHDNNGGRQRSLFLVVRLLTCIPAVGGPSPNPSNHSSELVSANCSKVIFAFLHALPLDITTVVVQGKASANHNFKG
jgi:hypothetical protein